MKDIYIATGITENYYQKAIPFIKSLNNNISNTIIKVVITLGFHATEDMKTLFPNIRFIYQDINLIHNELSYIKCLQHGAFMDALDGIVNDDDIIIFSDSDVIIQRDLNISDIIFLSQFNDTNIACNNNSSKRTLLIESQYLGMTISYREIQDYFKDFSFSKNEVYCTGNVTGKPNAWRKLRKLYVKDWEFIDRAMTHYAKQQFLMSIIMRRDFNFIYTPDSIHTHNCWGFPDYIKEERGIFKMPDGIPLLFSHHF